MLKEINKTEKNGQNISILSPNIYITKYMLCRLGLRMTQQWLRTFDASGEEVGWL